MTCGYAIIRQRWTIAFAPQLRSRGTLVAPLAPPTGLADGASVRVVFSP